MTPVANVALTVDPEVVVTSGAADRDYSEMLAAADPENANHLIACTMTYSGADGRWPTAVYESHDGGHTWRFALEDDAGRTDLLGDDDPSCAFGLGGEAWFNSSSDIWDHGWQDFVQNYYRSTDSGSTWRLVLAERGRPHGMANTDRPYLSVDTSHSPHRGNVYAYAWDNVFDNKAHMVGASVFLARLINDHLSPIVTLPNAGDYLGAAPMAGQGAVARDGTLVIPMLIFANGGRPRPTQVAVTLSRDGGRSLTIPKIIAETKMCTPGDPPVTAAVDTSSGPYANRMYIAWTAPIGKDAKLDYPAHCQTELAYSSDGGRTWSSPTLTHETSFAGHPATQAASVVSVNSNGVVALTWLDTRDDIDGNVMRPRIALSYDGGRSLSSSVPISKDGEDYRLAQPFGFEPQLSGGASPRNRIFPEPSGPLSGGVYPFADFNGVPGHTRSTVAAADGTFHDFWYSNTLSPDHATKLLTTTIQAAGRAWQNGDAFLEAMKDVTSRVALKVASSRYDASAETLTLSLRAVNNSDRALRGPIYLRFLWLGSTFGPPEVTSETVNGVSTNGAIVPVTATARAQLAPWLASTPITITFHVRHPAGLTYNKSSLLNFEARAYAPK